MQHDHVLKSWIMTYWSHSQGGGGSVCKIFATMLLHSWFSLIWYASWPYSETVAFWPTDPIPRDGVWSVCRGSAGNHVSPFVILFNLICNMTMFWKKLNFDLLTPYKGSKCGVCVGGSAGNHIAAFVILFNLTCNMTMFWTWPYSETVEFWPTDPIPRVCVCVGGGGCGKNKLLPCCCILGSHWFNMQHDHILKKLNYDLLTPSPGLGW